MIDLKRKILLGADIIDARNAFDPKVRANYMNASEVDNCIRRQWYTANMPDKAAPQEWGYARRGKNAERYVVECLIAANVGLQFTGEEQVSLYSDEYGISGTPDGFIRDPDLGGCTGVEIKSFDPRKNTSRFPEAKHVAQLQVCMRLLSTQPETQGLPMLGGLLIYINASDFNDIHQFVVDYDGEILEKHAARAKRLLGTRNVDRLDREGKSAGGYECKLCAFSTICGVQAADMGTRGRARANRGSNLEATAATYLTLKQKEKAIGEEIASNAEVIKQELRARKVAKVLVAGIEIDLQTVAGRTTLDRKAVAAAGFDLSLFEKTGAPSERLVVKQT